MTSKETIVKTVTITCLFVLIALSFYFLILGWRAGQFDSVASLKSYIASFGMWAPLVLTLIQFCLTILPVCPSFMGCVVGATLFGRSGGFWTNYIGISGGSIAAYWLAKKFGTTLVNKMIPMQKYEPNLEKMKKSKNYSKVLFFAILLPLAPDNCLCYFSGLIHMPAKRFAAIIITAKPWCILVYSIFFTHFI